MMKPDSSVKQLVTADTSKALRLG